MIFCGCYSHTKEDIIHKNKPTFNLFHLSYFRFFSTFEIKNAIVISMPGDALCQTRRGAFKTLLNIYDGAL